MGQQGLEPRTVRLWAGCSNQLSYWPFYMMNQKLTKSASDQFLSTGIELFFQTVASQVSSSHMSLTSVFGMGTGVTSSPYTPIFETVSQNKACNQMSFFKRTFTWFKRKSPRPISTCKLNMSPCLHSKPINLIVFEGSYSLKEMGYLILRAASRLDAFSVYPFRT